MRSLTRGGTLAAFVAAFLLSGAPRAAGPAEAKKAAPAAGDPAGDPAAARAAALRKKVLRDEDFLEAEETNRDPFHSYLRLFVDKVTIKTRKVPAVFDKYGLEELSLIAIVSGDADPRAMFRDASGLGQTVKKGDYISKTAARITKILSDRVIVEQSETNAAGETRSVEKAIIVNPEEAGR
jgi:Tfp pilus assembly protein PilP